MLLIPCPYCGPRPENEFIHGGEAAGALPDDLHADQAAWLDRVYVRANPKGPHAEHWYHRFGCRRWLRVLRHTVTHEILRAEPPAPAPQREPQP